MGIWLALVLALGGNEPDCDDEQDEDDDAAAAAAATAAAAAPAAAPAAAAEKFTPAAPPAKEEAWGVIPTVVGPAMPFINRPERDRVGLGAGASEALRSMWSRWPRT